MTAAGPGQDDGVILRTENAVFSYGTRPVLRGVSLEIRRGEFFALAGPNGAGKTTLLHLLTGYLAADSGSVELEGTALPKLSRHQVARRIAYVPQRSDFVFPFRVQEVVLMGRQPYAGLAAFDTEEDCRAAAEALEAVGLAEAARRRFEELSGGERQLVLIARALAQKAPVMVLDEPATFLDLKRQWQVMELLARRRTEGDTIVATFHDLNLAARWATRLALLCDGRIWAMGAPEEVLRPETLETVYGLPLSVEMRPDRPPLVELPCHVASDGVERGLR